MDHITFKFIHSGLKLDNTDMVDFLCNTDISKKYIL